MLLRWDWWSRKSKSSLFVYLIRVSEWVDGWMDDAELPVSEGSVGSG